MSLKTMLNSLHDATPKELEQKMESIANELFFRYAINYNNKNYFITAIEFYPDDDPFTHRHIQQLTNAYWYFHKAKSKANNSEKLLPITRLGLDITIGNNKKCGGILLRGIRREDDSCIDGPAKLINAMLGEEGKPLKQNSSIIYKRIRAIEKQSNIFENKLLKLISYSSPSKSILKKTRIGLFPKGNRTKEAYAKKEYHFYTQPK